MSEPTVQDNGNAGEPNGEPEPQQGEPADNPLGPNGEKALTAEREARKAAEKSATDLKAKLDEIEQANLSELEKSQRAAKDAQDQLAELTRQNLRNSVALAKGVPADLVDFLTGDSEDELNKKADVLLSRLSAPTTPRPDLSQGSKGSSGPQSTADQFAEVISEAFPS